MSNRCDGGGVVHESLLSLVMFCVCRGSDVGEGKLDGIGSAHISLLLFLTDVVDTMLLCGAGANKLDVDVVVKLLTSSVLLQILLKTTFLVISHVGRLDEFG